MAIEELAFQTASFPRRFAALLVDWIASTLVAIVIVGGGEKYSEPGSPATFVTLAVYVVETGVFTWLLAGSFGKVATGLRVVPADGVLRPMNPIKLLARQVMIALVVPPLIFRPDGRGLHDVMAGTATVPVATFRAMVERQRRR